jgi:predicted nucleotidyltransferase
MEDYLGEKFGIDVEIVTIPALKNRIKSKILKEVSYVS